MHLGVILLLARRNLRRTLLTATAFIIGGAMLTFSQTFDAGTHEQLIDSGVRTGSGHVSVEGPGFRLSRKIEDCLPGGTLQLVRQAVVSSGVAERVTDVFYRMSVSGLAATAIYVTWSAPWTHWPRPTAWLLTWRNMDDS